MLRRNFPPTRKSISQKGAVNPFGPHHCITYFGSVHAFQTNSRGASKTLVTIIRSFSFTVFFVISDLDFFHLIHNHIQLVETLFPELAIANRPVADCLYRLWPKRARALFPASSWSQSAPAPGRQYVLKSSAARGQTVPSIHAQRQAHGRVVRSSPGGLDPTKPQTLSLIYPQPYGSELFVNVKCGF